MSDPPCLLTSQWNARVDHGRLVRDQLLNSPGYFTVTGKRPPQPPPAAADYTRAGLPWFDYFDAEREALEGAAKLAGLDSVAAMSIKKGAGVIADNWPIGAPKVKALGPAGAVREGEF